MSSAWQTVAEAQTESALADCPAPVTPNETSTPLGPGGWQPRVWRLAWLTLTMVCLWAVPWWVERVQYAVTRGQQRAKADVARTELASLNSTGEAFRLVAQSVEPGVVHVDAVRVLPEESLAGAKISDRAPTQRTSKGEGSGVVVDAGGWVVTNYHVIADAQHVDVHLSDGRTARNAEVVGIDPLTDLAVLRVDLDQLTAVPWGSSETLEVGDWVLAVGNPFGLDRSVTAGIVSAKREHGVINDNPHQTFLQTDAAVNPGNSGGPLVNLRGEIVGINTQIVGQSFQGVSFAIPSALAQEVYERLRREGRVRRGWLGVAQRELTPELTEELGLGQFEGSVVSEVLPRSPADRAGLLPSDLITRWNGVEVHSPSELSRRVAETEIGLKVEVNILRGGQPLTLNVTVSERPER